MIIKAALKKKANAIARKYSGWHYPQEISSMYNELESIGVEVGMLTNRRENGAGSWYCEGGVYVDGELVSNCVLVYQVYEGNQDTVRNEYNIYFS